MPPSCTAMPAPPDVGPCRVVLLFDVLHMLRPPEQETLLATVSAALEPGGVVLIREADASGGWRFAVVRFGNRVKALVFRSLAAAVSLPHDRRMARLFRLARIGGTGAADERGHAVRQRAVPGYRSGARVCHHPPTFTSCLIDTAVPIEGAADPQPARDARRPGRRARREHRLRAYLTDRQQQAASRIADRTTAPAPRHRRPAPRPRTRARARRENSAPFRANASRGPEGSLPRLGHESRRIGGRPASTCHCVNVSARRSKTNHSVRLAHRASTIRVSTGP